MAGGEHEMLRGCPAGVARPGQCDIAPVQITQTLLPGVGMRYDMVTAKPPGWYGEGADPVAVVQAEVQEPFQVDAIGLSGPPGVGLGHASIGAKERCVRAHPALARVRPRGRRLGDE